ncbi:MAG: hypothetical protein IJ530_14755 [Treponema sp.]|uniref:hypothetical protein n=1 Tax=Treponema sp. TaxID=166 RepID=UPI0025FD073A|nr:hypothetical protein [Treponema sp.]MBQ8680988.1 hypothetical protein [Treponema sp.]
MQIDELVLREKKEIKCKEYFHNLEPWKDGKLVTMDGWGRFSTFEITEKDKIRITPLVQFPKKKIDATIKAYPDLNFIHATSYMAVHYFADVESGRTFEVIPIKSPNHYARYPFIIDREKKLLLIPYGGMTNDHIYDYVIYDFNHNEVIYNPIDVAGAFHKPPVFFSFEDGNFLCYERDSKDIRKFDPKKICMFNYNKNEYTNNKLTDFWTLKKPYSYIKVMGQNKFIMSYYEGETVILTYNEDFSEIDVKPFFPPTVKGGSRFFRISLLSEDLKWAAGRVYDYSSPYDDNLKKDCFVCIDEGSPLYGIPVVTEDYYPSGYPKGRFITHPIYGTCFIEKIEKDGKNYIRLYKMSDIQAEIDKYLLEKAKSAISKV